MLPPPSERSGGSALTQSTRTGPLCRIRRRQRGRPWRAPPSGLTGCAVSLLVAEPGHAVDPGAGDASRGVALRRVRDLEREDTGCAVADVTVGGHRRGAGAADLCERDTRDDAALQHDARAGRRRRVADDGVGAIRPRHDRGAGGRAGCARAGPGGRRLLVVGPADVDDLAGADRAGCRLGVVGLAVAESATEAVAEGTA